MATALAQTITVVKGKKVVSTSKQLINVYKEAKAAYREKKAELKSNPDPRSVDNNGRAIEGARRGQSYSPGSASPNGDPRRRDYRRTDSPAHDRRPLERGNSDSFYANDNDQRYYNQPQAAWGNQHFARSDLDLRELSRTYSDSDLRELRQPPYSSTVANNRGMEGYLTESELPPPLPARHTGDEHELRMKVFSLNNLLAEANCMQHSARAIIKHLETNPEAMAAVALSLAEISNLLTKMAPGALLSFKTGAPAVIALLLSSEFLIAAGVGVGLTVVALGGYKIIKRIKAKRASEKEQEPEELEDITADLDNIKTWRRGVSEDDARSIGSNVEGEFATPTAAQHFRDIGVLPSRNGAGSSSNVRRSQSMPRDAPGGSSGQLLIQEKPKPLSGLRNVFKKRQDALA